MRKGLPQSEHILRTLETLRKMLRTAKEEGSNEGKEMRDIPIGANERRSKCPSSKERKPIHAYFVRKG